MNTAVGPARNFAASLAVVGLIATAFVVAGPVAAQDDPVLCNGLVVTVDIGAGETPTDGDDVILGTNGPDLITAGDGNDVVCGLGGDDTIWGQDGDDWIDGGDGDDKLRGSDGDDELYGSDGVDDLAGGRDNDIVDGGDGDDAKVRGGTGDDIVNGGPGDDQLVNGNGGVDIVDGGPGDDALVSGGPRPDIVRGGEGNDVVKGLGGADELFGGPGDDEVFGGAQPDTIDGGEGTDVCNGGIQDDTGINCETYINVEAADNMVSPPLPADRVLSIDLMALPSILPLGEAYAEYVAVYDDTQMLVVEAPAEFIAVQGEPGGTGPTLAISEIDGPGPTNPALFITVRPSGGAVDVLFEAIAAESQPFMFDCVSVLGSGGTSVELDAPEGFEGLFFADGFTADDLVGAYAVFEGCPYGAGGTSTSVGFAALLAPGDKMVAIAAFLPTQADVVAFERAIATVNISAAD